MSEGKIVVKFKKVEHRGQIKDKIMEVNAFPKSRLPREYLTDGAYVFMKLSKAKVPMLVTPEKTYVVGELLTRDQVSDMLCALEEAGDRLHQINIARKAERIRDAAIRRKSIGREWVHVI